MRDERRRSLLADRPLPRRALCPGDVVEVRRLPSKRSTWHLACDADAIAATCTAANEQGENVYVGVNPRPRYGAKGDACIAVARSLFVDLDGAHLGTTDPAEQIHEAIRRVADAWLPDPSMLVHSGHGVHAYWLLTEPVTDLDRWALVMDALVMTLGSDPSCKNSERIMRVPGLANHKPPKATARLVHCDPSRRFDVEDLAGCVMHANLPEPPDVPEVADVEELVRGRE